MAKPEVTLRNSKGSPLNYTELDTNFTNLRDSVIGFTDGVNTAEIDLNSALTVSGVNITVGVDPQTNTLTLTGIDPDLSNYVTLDGAQTITGSKTFTGTTTLGPYRESVYDIGNSGSGTITPDALNAPVQTITATGNFTLALPTGIAAGSNLVLIIAQDATGSRTVTFNSSYLFSNGLKTLSTQANSIDIVTVYYDGSRYLCSLLRNYS